MAIPWRAIFTSLTVGGIVLDHTSSKIYSKDDIDSRLYCRQDVAIPWRAIFTSLPVWGIVLGHASSNWGNYTLNQQLPTYLTDVLRFNYSIGFAPKKLNYFRDFFHGNFCSSCRCISKNELLYFIFF